MKIMRKILSLLLFLAMLLEVFTLSSEYNVYAEDNNKNNILEEIKNNNFVDIKKIEMDSKKQRIKSVNDVNISSRAFNIDDGTYLIDRGYGWVLGNDASFVESGFAGPGEYLRLLKGKVSKTEHNILAGVGLELDFEFVKATVEVAYEHTISEETNMMVGFEITAPKDKNVYVKTYTTFRRFDMIKVKNGGITGHSSTYEVTGTWPKCVTYRNGETVNQGDLIEKVTRNVLGEPEVIDIKNTISVKGLDYIKNLDILVNSSSKSLELINRSNTKIHPGFFSNDYFTIKLFDEFGKEKASMKMSGNDYSNNPKFDNFSRVPYSIGDTIEIVHEEPFRLNISGPISGKPTKNKRQIYRITKDGLEYISEGVYNIKLKKDPSQFLVRNYSGFGIIISPNVDKNSNSSKWEFTYDMLKGAYIIRNMETNKVLASKYYSSILPNTIQAIDEPNDDSKYFKILNLGNNEIALINLKTGLAVTVDEYNSLSKSASYINSDNQKFILEKR